MNATRVTNLSRYSSCALVNQSLDSKSNCRCHHIALPAWVPNAIRFAFGSRVRRCREATLDLIFGRVASVRPLRLPQPTSWQARNAE